MEKAVRLAPSHAFNTALLADALFFAGRVDESAEKIKRAMRLSPIYPAWYLAMLGACYHVMKENELAISTLKEGVELEPDSPLCKLWLTSSLVERGMLEEAKSVAREVMRIEPNFSTRDWKDLVFKDAPR